MSASGMWDIVLKRKYKIVDMVGRNIYEGDVRLVFLPESKETMPFHWKKRGDPNLTVS